MPSCSRPATRIYVPTEDARPACRRCWGLTYESRQERNYKPGHSYLAYLGLSPLNLAHSLAHTARVTRAEAAAKRYAERREILGAIPARPLSRPDP